MAYTDINNEGCRGRQIRLVRINPHLVEFNINFFRALIMLKWDHRYELGNERIDAEHRIFLGLIVDFHDAVNQGAPNDKLIRIFKEIGKYAAFHFVSEENIMTDYLYPEQEQHAELHRRLLSEIDDKFYQLSSGSIDPDDVFEFLFEWFAFHTSTEDKKLVGYLGNK